MSRQSDPALGCAIGVIVGLLMWAIIAYVVVRIFL